MKACEKCPLRKYMAKYYDMHWLGEDDCPYECNDGTVTAYLVDSKDEVNE